ncbi:MAG TPA: PaaX family transcriptional regulator C-terminal domain-containing protein [Pseudonocardiaceae bacterium]|jgi:phenylacetic acid degradation operon negative regulatory protein|nr:PaaX family transcriptional regulator C-terminal domain-containing protein [Pseudonocardiaceae bacterium]
MVDDGPQPAQEWFEPTPQELVTTLAGAYLQPRAGREVWSGGLVALLAEFGFSAGAARVALARMVRADLLAPAKRGRLVYYTLTPRMIAVLADGDRRIFSLGRRPEPEGHNGQWTVLWQAIPDEARAARERLVRRLRFLGFGSLQDGTWISPHDRESQTLALLDELDVAKYAGLLLGRPALALDVRGLVDRIWDLDALARRYQTFVAQFARAPQPHSDRDAWQSRTQLVHTFRQFPFLDPELPQDLIAAPAGRAEAIELFHARYPALAPAAQRYFDEVTNP